MSPWEIVLYFPTMLEKWHLSKERDAEGSKPAKNSKSPGQKMAKPFLINEPQSLKNPKNGSVFGVCRLRSKQHTRQLHGVVSHRQGHLLFNFLFDLKIRVTVSQNQTHTKNLSIPNTRQSAKTTF